MKSNKDNGEPKILGVIDFFCKLRFIPLCMEEAKLIETWLVLRIM
jgi:hypothetical protein